MKILKRFTEFVNESFSESNVIRGFAGFVNRFGLMKDEHLALLELIKSAEKESERMMDRRTYWYNRESRNFNQDHYAIDVKVHKWPDLDEWREAIEDPEASEEIMTNQWYAFINQEADDFEEYFLEEFGDTFDKILFGGKSGGWMCLVPSSSPETLISDLETYIEEYEYELSNLDEDEVAKLTAFFAIPEEEREGLDRIGFLETPRIVKEIKDKYDELELIVKDVNKTLFRHQEACEFVIKKHSEFEKTAEANFIEWAKY